MAMSLLYALLGVNNPTELEELAKQSTYQSRSPSDDENRRLAIKYHNAELKQKKEVRKALYDSLYHMLEYSSVNRTQSMAIGKLLCNVLQDPPMDLQGDPHIVNLYENLRLTVTEAITEAIEESQP
jgi:hypothetical protein